jgi:hypothetical protein
MALNLLIWLKLVQFALQPKRDAHLPQRLKRILHVSLLPPRGHIRNVRRLTPAPPSNVALPNEKTLLHFPPKPRIQNFLQPLRFSHRLFRRQVAPLLNLGLQRNLLLPVLVFVLAAATTSIRIETGSKSSRARAQLHEQCVTR